MSVLCIRDRTFPPGSWSEALESAVGERGTFTVISASRFSVALLEAAIAPADCVFLESYPGDAGQLIDLQQSLHALVERGGTLVANATLAPPLGRSFVTSVASQETADGLNLLPDCIVQAAYRRGADAWSCWTAILARWGSNSAINRH